MIGSKDAFLEGMSKLASVVGETLGPNGNLIAYQTVDGTRLTKDGVTVAEFVELDDPVEKMGAEFLRSVSKKLVQAAGDGTTTVTVLTWAIIEEVMRVLKLSTSDSKVSITAKQVEDYLQMYKIQLLDSLDILTGEIDEDRLRYIARVSANDADLANLIVDAIEIVGQEGIVEVVNGERESRMEHVNGINWKKGYITNHFVTDSEAMHSFYRDASILIYDGVVSTQEQVVPVLQYSIDSQQPILFIANDFTDVAAQTLIMNKLRRGVNIVPVRGPGVGQSRSDFYDDLSVMVGAKHYREKVDSLSTGFDPSRLGSAEKIKITQDSTTIVNPHGDVDAVQRRIESLRNFVKLAEKEYDKEKYLERIGRLANKVVLLYVAGSTEIEIREKRDRVEDSLKAIKEALYSGFVPGGGSALLIAGKALRAADTTEIARTVRECMVSAVNAPFRLIAKNSGYDPNVMQNEAYSKNGIKNLWVWNATDNTFQRVEDTTIIDPASVTKLALQVAVDTACMAIRTSYALLPDRDYQSQFSDLAL